MESKTTPVTEQQSGNNLSQAGMDRKIEKKLWTPKRIGMAGGGGMLILFILYSFIFGDTSSKLNVEAEKITISEVSRGLFQEFIPVNGSVLPIETFYLGAIEGGRVERLFVDAGTCVKKGDPILRLANTTLQLDVMFREALSYEQINNAQNRRLAIEQNSISVRSQLAEVEYQVQRTRLSFDRDSVLMLKNLISSEEFKRTRDEHDYWLRPRVFSL